MPDEKKLVEKELEELQIKYGKAADRITEIEKEYQDKCEASTFFESENKKLEKQFKEMRRRNIELDAELIHLRQDYEELKKKKERREITEGIFTGTHNGDKLDRVLRTALEEGMPLEQIIDILWFRFEIAPDEAIELIKEYAEKVDHNYNFESISFKDIKEKAVDRIRKKDSVREGLDELGLSIGEDVKEYYEAQLAENPNVEKIKHEILFCPTLAKAQHKFMQLKEEIADEGLKEVYRFMSSPFTRTIG